MLQEVSSFAARAALPLLLGLLSPLAACGGVESADPDGGTGDGGTCALAADTTPTSATTNGCARLVRDTSSCAAVRSSQGLTGAWLEFSCRVTLGKTSTAIQLASDGQPDYTSNYFPAASPCWAAYSPASPDPNQIAPQSLTINVPLSPDATHTPMALGPVGMAVNGVAIFGNRAAPGDDIFRESDSFDRCGGHPAPMPAGMYHYHGEPEAISHDDSNLIGVLRDGYFVYGRRDADGSLPALDARGGHAGPPPGGATPVYHYHLNLQTSTSPGTTGQQQWFLTTGIYQGAPL